MDGWKLIALFVVQIRDIEVWLRSKINYNYSWFLRSGSSRLIKWIYKERYELLLLKRKQQHNYSLSKQTQPRFLLLACLPPCNVAYAFIQLARKRVQRFEKMAGIVNKVYCACSLTSSIEGKWPRLFIMLAAFFWRYCESVFHDNLISSLYSLLPDGNGCAARSVSIECLLTCE